MDGTSVIIAVKGKSNLTNLLESIDPNVCEVLIIGESLENYNLSGMNVKLIYTDENRSVARNMGAEQAQHQFLLFLDSDMELTGNLIKESIKEMSSLDALIFPEITLGNTLVAKGRRFERLGLYRSLYFEAPRMIRKDVFFEVGGYNPRLNAFEDLDLTRKIVNGNFKIGWSNCVIYHHEENINLIGYIRKRITYTTKNKTIFTNFDKEYSRQLVKIKNRYNSFLNSIRIYKMRSACYLPFYFVVTLINLLTYMLIK
jgi:hypothetical protein